MALPVSFAGVSSGLKYDSLIEAIIQSESGTLDRMQSRQAANERRKGIMQQIRSALDSLGSSLFSLSSTTFDARSISSSDPDNKYVSGSAAGAAAGTYDVVVKNLATRANLVSPSAGLASADSTEIGVGEWTITDTNGTTKTITIDSNNNNLNGLRDAINASGANIMATIIQTSESGNSFKLALQAKDLGSGTAAASFSIKGTSDNALGFNSDTGSYSSEAQNANITINGVEITRKSNTITDAVQGLTLNLRQADETKTTSFTVSQDKTAITNAMQDVINKFNSVTKLYKDNSGQNGVLAGDTSVRMFIQNLRSQFVSSPAGLSSSNAYQSPGDAGISVGSNGQLSLDVTAFQKALDTNPSAVRRLFASSGTPTTSNMSFVSSTNATATGSVGYEISPGFSGGNGTATLIYNSVRYENLTISNGNLSVDSDSPLKGLKLKVTGEGNGTLQLTRGNANSIQEIAEAYTSPGGSIANMMNSIEQANTHLSQQISSAQDRLTKRQQALKAQFSRMEAMLGQIQAAGQSLSAIR